MIDVEKLSSDLDKDLPRAVKLVHQFLDIIFQYEQTPEPEPTKQMVVSFLIGICSILTAGLLSYGNPHVASQASLQNAEKLD